MTHPSPAPITPALLYLMLCLSILALAYAQPVVRRPRSSREQSLIVFPLPYAGGA